MIRVVALLCLKKARWLLISSSVAGGSQLDSGVRWRTAAFHMRPEAADMRSLTGLFQDFVSLAGNSGS